MTTTMDHMLLDLVSWRANKKTIMKVKQAFQSQLSLFDIVWLNQISYKLMDTTPNQSHIQYGPKISVKEKKSSSYFRVWITFIY